MNAVSSTILIVLLLVVCFAPRRWALLAMMAGVFFLTQGHAVQIGGLSLWPIRFLEAFACVRVLQRRELVWSQLNRIDWALLLVYNYAAIVWILRSPDVEPQRFAAALDPTLCYLALRGLIGNLDDLRWLLNNLVLLLVPFTALVFVERITGTSAFSLVGASPVLYLREDVPRCQGTFRHAILLGSVAASFLPLYVALWLAGTRRTIALLGGLLCLSLIALSNSAGPLTSALAVFLGWSIWLLRDSMRLVRRVVLGQLVFLLLFMKAPIWYLPFKISALIGGGGYHRGRLMDQAWQDLEKWWLVGMDSRDTARWFPYLLTVGDVESADITNQFVVFGVRGGLAAVAISVAVLVFAFKGLGKALAAARLSGARGRDSEFLLWGLGVAIFVHAVSWLGVSYFDQSWVIWLMHLAAISAAVQSIELGTECTAAVAAVPARLSRLRLRRKRICRLPRRRTRRVLTRPAFVRTGHLEGNE